VSERIASRSDFRRLRPVFHRGVLNGLGPAFYPDNEYLEILERRRRSEVQNECADAKLQLDLLDQTTKRCPDPLARLCLLCAVTISTKSTIVAEPATGSYRIELQDKEPAPKVPIAGHPRSRWIPGKRPQRPVDYSACGIMFVIPSSRLFRVGSAG
jgi:hypothetical protein